MNNNPSNDRKEISFPDVLATYPLKKEDGTMTSVERSTAQFGGKGDTGTKHAANTTPFTSKVA